MDSIATLKSHDHIQHKVFYENTSIQSEKTGDVRLGIGILA